MGKIAFFEVAAGLSGDMFIGALLDAGLPLETLAATLARLGIDGEFSIGARSLKRKGIAAVKFDVTVNESKTSRRDCRAIKKLIESSSLDEPVKLVSMKILTRLAQAEGEVHGVEFEDVHFHEIGAVDTIVDIVGAAVGIDYFRIEKVFSSPINLGSGTVTIAGHGTLAVPAPATARLLIGAPSYAGDETRELTTPTGAAILTSLKPIFSARPAMIVESEGFGAGAHELDRLANIFRLSIGAPIGSDSDSIGKINETVVELTTNIDDMDPRRYEPLISMAFESGALDCSLTPIIMKKSRPAIRLEIIAPLERAGELEDLIFNETTTLGVRRKETGRRVLPRSIERVATSVGSARIKRAENPDGSEKISVEHEDLLALSKSARERYDRINDEALVAAMMKKSNRKGKGKK